MNIWKKLFPDPPPPEQREINLGELLAIVNLKNGDHYKFPIKGEYFESRYVSCFGGTWIDDHITARTKFKTWKQKIKDSGFLRVDENLFISYNEILDICVENEKEVIITTTRSR